MSCDAANKQQRAGVRVETKPRQVRWSSPGSGHQTPKTSVNWLALTAARLIADAADGQFAGSLRR